MHAGSFYSHAGHNRAMVMCVSYRNNNVDTMITLWKQ